MNGSLELAPWSRLCGKLWTSEKDTVSKYKLDGTGVPKVVLCLSTMQTHELAPTHTCEHEYIHIHTIKSDY